MDGTYVCLAADGTQVSTNCSTIGNQDYSLDGSVCGFLSDGTLYCSSNGEVQRVADEVAGFAVSVDGSAIVYISNVGDDHYGTLSRYTVSDGSSKEITTQALYDSDFPFLIASPDGNSVAFLSDLNEDEERFEASISVNQGNPTTLGTNLLPLAISNDGTYI